MSYTESACSRIGQHLGEDGHIEVLGYGERNGRGKLKSYRVRCRVCGREWMLSEYRVTHDLGRCECKGGVGHATKGCPIINGKRCKPGDVVYMAVTADEFEMPVYITDTLQEMSVLTGRTTRDISVLCSKSAKKVRYQSAAPGCYRYYRVIIEED